MAVVIAMAVGLKFPRFYQFEPAADNVGYKTTSLMEDHLYIEFNAYWDDLCFTGFVPLIALLYFNVRIYLRVCWYYVIVWYIK